MKHNDSAILRLFLCDSGYAFVQYGADIDSLSVYLSKTIINVRFLRLLSTIMSSALPKTVRGAMYRFEKSFDDSENNWIDTFVCYST